MSSLRKTTPKIGKAIRDAVVPYLRPKSPRKDTWSLPNLFSFIKSISRPRGDNNNNTGDDDLESQSSNSDETPSDPVPAPPSTGSTMSVENLLNGNESSQESSTATSTPSPSSTPLQIPQQSTLSAPGPSSNLPSSPSMTFDSPIVIDNDNNNSSSSASTDRILEWARKKLADRQPLNEMEVAGLQSYLTELERQQSEETYEPEKLCLTSPRRNATGTVNSPPEEGRSSSPTNNNSSLTPTFSGHSTLPTFTNITSSTRYIRQQQQKGRKMLKKDPNGPIYWRGAGRARVTPAPASRPQQQKPQTNDTSKRRRISEDSGSASSSAQTFASTTVDSGEIPLSHDLPSSSKPSAFSPGNMSMPERIHRATIIRPRTTPAVSSPLRNNVVNGGSPPSPETGSDSITSAGTKAKTGLGFAVSLMEDVIKNNTPEPKPDVGNPYEASCPVKKGIQTNVRTRLSGKRKERERSTGVEVPASSVVSKEKEKEKELSVKEIIEATVPKGAKRSRPTAADLQKSRANLESLFSGQQQATQNASQARSPFQSQPIIEEPDEKKARGTQRTNEKRPVTIEEVSDSEVSGFANTSGSSLGSYRNMKPPTSSFVTPSEIIEPKENSVKASPSVTNANAGNGNTGKAFGMGKSSLPKEPSKLRKSYVAASFVEDDNEDENIAKNGKKTSYTSTSTSSTFSSAFGAKNVSGTESTASIANATSAFTPASGSAKNSAFPPVPVVADKLPTYLNPFGPTNSKTSTTSSSTTAASGPTLTVPSNGRPLGVVQERVPSYDRSAKEIAMSLLESELPTYTFKAPAKMSVINVLDHKRTMDAVKALPADELPVFKFEKRDSGSASGSKVTMNATTPTSASTPTFPPLAKTASFVKFDYEACGMKRPVSLEEKGEWQCDRCMLSNAQKLVKCSVCDLPRPELKSKSKETGSSVKGGSTPSAITSVVSAGTSSASSGFNYEAAGLKRPASLEEKKEWKCGLCMLINPDSLVKCSICEAPKPGYKEPDTKASSGSTPLTPVPTNTSAPTSSGGFNYEAAGMKRPDSLEARGEWLCNACMCTNDNKLVKCGVCESPR